MPRILTIALLLLAGLAASPARSEPQRFCGDDYWFTAEPPDGWVVEERYDTMGLTLDFHPAGELEPMIMAKLPMGHLRREAQAVDLDEALDGWISLLNAFGAPSRIADWEMRHPTLPTRSVLLEAEGDRLYVSVFDAGSGRGHTFVAFLPHAGPAAPELLRTCSSARGARSRFASSPARPRGGCGR